MVSLGKSDVSSYSYSIYICKYIYCIYIYIYIFAFLLKMKAQRHLKAFFVSIRMNWNLTLKRFVSGDFLYTSKWPLFHYRTDSYGPTKCSHNPWTPFVLGLCVYPSPINCQWYRFSGSPIPVSVYLHKHENAANQ